MLKIFRGIESYSSSRDACVTAGTFDGIHIGHKKILNKVSQEAHDLNFESVLITFDPHPRKVLFPDQAGLQLINTLEEKLQLLESCNISSVIVHPFTLEFSRTSALIYVRDLLVNQVKMKNLVIGYDHQFGKNREGSIEQLSELAPLYDFKVNEIPAQDIDDVKISSTKIRYALSDGHVKEANTYLGYEFFITGIVIRGKGRGKGLGYPTANINIGNPDKIVPKPGVYLVFVDIDGASHKGVLNIGNNPTFELGDDQSIEVHILDFDREIYDQKMQIRFIERIRDEVRFESKEALITQIGKDIERAREL